MCSSFIYIICDYVRPIISFFVFSFLSCFANFLFALIHSFSLFSLSLSRSIFRRFSHSLTVCVRLFFVFKSPRRLILLSKCAMLHLLIAFVYGHEKWTKKKVCLTVKICNFKKKKNYNSIVYEILTCCTELT